MKTLITKFLVLAISFAAAGSSAVAISNEKIVTYHIELGEWPARMRPVAESAVSELVAKEGCWAVDPNGAVEHNAKPAEGRCAKFVRFQSAQALKPWKRNPTNAKYYASFAERGGAPEIRLKIFVWDGKKLRRAVNSTFRRNIGSSQEIRDLMVKWALK